MSYPSGLQRRVAVIGGGIAGLTAAYTLKRARQAGALVDEALIEASNRLGGVIHTESVQGFLVEGGPDSFLTEKPEAAELCRELGLGNLLIGSNDHERITYILHEGRLVPLPEGLMLLVPTRLKPLMDSPLLPFWSKLAIVAEWFMDRPKSEKPDESVAMFVRRHFGNAMLENIVDPLLAGVYGGDSASLSAASVLPRFYEMERKYGSLVRGVLLSRWQMSGARNKRPGSLAPRSMPTLFTTLKGGLGQLIARLTEELDTSRLHLGQRVVEIERVGPKWMNPYRIRCEGQTVFEAEAVVLALPAHQCANILSSLNPRLSQSLQSVPYSSAITVTLGFDKGVAETLPPGFGFLVPKKEGLRLLACTFVHSKFSYRAPEGKALLRCFLGGTRDESVMRLSDVEIITCVREELRKILGLTANPLFRRISRWPAAMAQYTVGHRERIGQVLSRAEQYPRFGLAGNAYSGIGLSDCIRTGMRAAQRAIDL